VKIKFAPGARAELDAVASAYDSLRPGLGEDFLVEAQRTLAYIREHPMARAPIIGSTRRWPLSRFPYGVLYAAENDTIYVLAVGHLRRDPEIWKQQARRPRE
jgi:hypothetical protein